MFRSLRRFLGLASLSSAAVLCASPTWAAWQSGVNYGGNVPMDLYVPDGVGTSPPIVVAIHYCQGNAGGVHSWFESLANTHKFLIIAPDAPGECFDATAARGGQREAIVQMVEYAIEEHGADPTRVYAAGASSGACMTNALLAAYPEVFAGGSVLAGVAAGAWTGGASGAFGLCSQCPSTPQAWGDIVRNLHECDGPRPRVQLWHGTSDTTLSYVPHLGYERDQWTNVFGVDDGDLVTGVSPPSGWSRESYGDGSGSVLLEVNIGQGKPHDLTGQGLYGDVVRFFGLDQSPPTGGVPTCVEAPAGSGGAPGAGGGSAAGGASAGTGGNFGAGGSGASAGGTTGAGGAPGGVGGATGAGGALAGSGGAPAGSGGAPGSDISFSDPGGGCGCEVAGGNGAQRSLGALAWFGFSALGLAALWRRRTVTSSLRAK